MNATSPEELPSAIDQLIDELLAVYPTRVITSIVTDGDCHYHLTYDLNSPFLIMEQYRDACERRSELAKRVDSLNAEEWDEFSLLTWKIDSHLCHTMDAYDDLNLEVVKDMIRDDITVVKDMIRDDITKAYPEPVHDKDCHLGDNWKQCPACDPNSYK